MKSFANFTALLSVLPLLATSATAFLLQARELVPSEAQGHPILEYYIHTIGLAPEQAMLKGTSELDFAQDFFYNASLKTLQSTNNSPITFNFFLDKAAPANTTGVPGQYHAVYIGLQQGTAGWSKPEGKGKPLHFKPTKVPTFGAFALCKAKTLGSNVKHLLTWRPQQSKASNDCADVEILQA